MYSGNYRHPYLDYTDPGIFLITFLKKPEIPYFSFLHEDKRFEVAYKRIGTRYYNIGQCLRRSFLEFQNKYTKMKIIQQAIMPDHVHFIFQIRQKLDEHAGRYLGRLKALMQTNAIKEGIVTPNVGSLFQTGFNDQYLHPGRSLQDLIDYVRENPYRLWVRREHPEFFEKNDNLIISGEECSSYGNQFLLQNPNKAAVVVHSAFSNEELEKRLAYWRYLIHNNGVLVSAFVNPLEKEIYKEAIARGAKVIKFDEVGKEKKWKPTRREFNLCESGRMLVVYPQKTGKMKMFRKDPYRISREECKFFNFLSESLETESSSILMK